MTKIDAARNLALAGLEVFPITPGAKAPPLIKAFPANATTDLAKIDHWWNKWPEANIGIHCKNLLVVDVDASKGGFDSLLELEIENGELPVTAISETPTGGQHLLFAHKGGVNNGVNVLGKGLDIRSDGGYIVGPGSTIKGKAYHWMNAEGPTPAPDWLVYKCRQNKVSVEVSAQVIPGYIDPETAVARAEEWLKTAPPANEGEGGDHHTFATICKVRDFGVPENYALDTILDWNDRCSPPWDIDELQRKIHNAYRYAQNEPGTESIEAMFDIVQNPAPSIITEQDDEIYTPDEISLDSVLLNEYLIKGWIDKGSQGLLFGQWGSGKTFIALHLAAHLSAGRPWFSHKVKQGGVLYLGYEGSAAMKKRVYAIRKEFPDWDLTTFMVRPLRWPLVKRGSDVKTKGMGHTERALAAFKERTGAYPCLVVIDPLRNALGGSDSDPDLTAPFLAYLQKLTKITGCSTLTIHHPGHADAERGRGDSGIEAHMDTVIKVDGERGRIETRKQRDDPKAAMYYKLKVVQLGVDLDGDIRTTCVAEQVSENPLDPGLTDQQQKVLDSLRELVKEDNVVTKTLLRQAAPNISTVVRADIFDVLLQKRYLVPDGKTWLLGAGAAEMFSEEDS